MKIFECEHDTFVKTCLEIILETPLMRITKDFGIVASFRTCHYHEK